MIKLTYAPSSEPWPWPASVRVRRALGRLRSRHRCDCLRTRSHVARNELGTGAAALDGFTHRGVDTLRQCLPAPQHALGSILQFRLDAKGRKNCVFRTESPCVAFAPRSSDPRSATCRNLPGEQCRASGHVWRCNVNRAPPPLAHAWETTPRPRSADSAAAPVTPHEYDPRADLA